MQFYDQLVKQTNTDKQKFYSRKIISSVLQEGVSKQLYLNYLAEAYNHVKYTCPLLEMSKNLMSLDKDKVFIDAFAVTYGTSAAMPASAQAALRRYRRLV